MLTRCEFLQSLVFSIVFFVVSPWIIDVTPHYQVKESFCFELGLLLLVAKMKKAKKNVKVGRKIMLELLCVFK